jgi:hypothetical protein
MSGQSARNTKQLNAMVDNLRARGVSLPRNAARAQVEALSIHKMAGAQPGSSRRYGFLDTSANSESAADDIQQNTRIIREMKRQRTASSMRKNANIGTGGGGDVFAAMPRFYDPLEYWDITGLPWNMADEGHRHKLHKWLRLYYATHYLVPILIDIFTRFPLSGMEIRCKDKRATKFYEELFLNDLNYPEFFVGLGREHFLVGEAFPLASFDDTLGIWEREELLNPEDIIIENFPLLGSRALKIVPPDYLKKLAQTKQPAREYRMLEMNFPELIPYLRKNEHIPISDVLLKQVANKFTSWDDHGTPMLLRGLRTLIHEEKLLASQDAIAERLYSPLILAKMGITDLGDGQGPWFPSPDELDALRDDMDVALSSDFRLLVHHMGLDITNVFGREQMPRLGDDFDRIERRLMQIFGINPSLLSAGANSQPYASSALQAEFMNQVLRTYQGHLKRHFQERAMVVAEAQGHYDYETRGETRVPIMEEVVVEDEDGNKHVEERHKLIDVELDFSVLDLRDEATERQFFQALRQQGVPIPDENLMIGVNIDFDEMVIKYNEDLEKKTIAQQAAKVKTYNALAAAGYPIPPDLKAEVEASRNGGTPPPPTGGGGPTQPPMPPGGGQGPHGGPGSPIVMPGPPGGIGGAMGAPGGPGQLGPGGIGGATPGGGAPPRGGMQPGPAGTVPDISNERRPGLFYGGSVEDGPDGDFELEDSGPRYPYNIDPGQYGKIVNFPPIDQVAGIPEPDHYRGENHPLTLHLDGNKGHRQYKTDCSNAWSQNFSPYELASGSYETTDPSDSAWFTYGHPPDENPEDLKHQGKTDTVHDDESESEGVRTKEARVDDTVIRLPQASKKRRYRLLDED